MISTVPKWVGNLFSNALKPNARAATISSLNAQIKKISFHCDISKMDFQIGYANVFRVNDTEYRNYTAAFHDKGKGIIDVIAHIYGNGPGCRFLDTLAVDDALYIGPSRGKKLYDPKYSHQLMFVDETSLGLAYAFHSLLKEHKHSFQFYFELNDENKDVPEQLGLENVTVFPKSMRFRDEAWIADLPGFRSEEWQNANFALSGNVKSVQTFRKVLKNKTSGNITSQGYWLEEKKGL